MKWYYLFSREWSMVVIDYFMAKDGDEFEKAEKFLERHSLSEIDYDVMGPFDSRKAAMEDALAWGKENFQKKAA